ncbi:cupin domain-containing protein [Salinigranum marinum]|uniref:cupin domain-containing protein n=1 Tax=Salinigranum marinum TaxID=1515595 RepID=UPI002989B999|nr:cupin domain-containing protein [Salinigranum marinum]
MPAHTSLDDLDAVSVDRSDTDASVVPVGYELRPSKMRPAVWNLPAGESTPYHRQREQEELYLALSGRFEVRLDHGDGDEETFEFGPRDVLVVEPDVARQLTALEDGELFVVGAPNVKDDGVVLDADS